MQIIRALLSLVEEILSSDCSMHVLFSCALSVAGEKAQLSSLSLFNLSLQLSFLAVVTEIRSLIFRSTKQKQITYSSLLLNTYINSVEQLHLLPILMSVRYVCSRLIVGIAISNPMEGISVRLLCLFVVV